MSTGVESPPKEYARASNPMKSTPILYRDHMKYYGILLKNGEVIADDFLLPHGSIGVSQAVDLDEIYFETSTYVTGIEDSYIFFRVSLEENEKVTKYYILAYLFWLVLRVQIWKNPIR